MKLAIYLLGDDGDVGKDGDFIRGTHLEIVPDVGSSLKNDLHILMRIFSKKATILVIVILRNKYYQHHYCSGKF